MVETALLEDARDRTNVRPRRLVYIMFGFALAGAVALVVGLAFAADNLLIDGSSIAGGFGAGFGMVLVYYWNLRVFMKKAEIFHDRAIMKAKRGFGVALLIYFATFALAWCGLMITSNILFRDYAHALSYSIGTVISMLILILPIAYLFEAEFGKVFIQYR